MKNKSNKSKIRIREKNEKSLNPNLNQIPVMRISKVIPHRLAIYLHKTKMLTKACFEQGLPICCLSDPSWSAEKAPL